MHLVVSGVLRSNYIKPWFHFHSLDSSAGGCGGIHWQSQYNYLLYISNYRHCNLPAHQHLKGKKAAFLHGYQCSLYVLITRKAQVVKIALRVSMGNTIKRIKCFQYRKKHFWVTGKKKLSARIGAGRSVFVCDFVWKHAGRWLLNAVTGPVSF